MIQAGYKPYPAYKESNVEWIGEIPQGWEVRKLKFCAAMQNKKAKVAEYKIALENIQSFTGKFIGESTPFEGEGLLFDNNSILYGKLRPYLCKVFLPQTNGICVSEFIVLNPQNEIVNKQFIFYLLLSHFFTDIVNGATVGTKMPRADWKMIGNFLLPLPPLPEQAAIAAFLDRETARINNIVEKQQRLIELLKEKRSALITQAVTKGLSGLVSRTDAEFAERAKPVRYTPSGVEWIGDIPEGWEVRKLKWVVKAKLKYGANEVAELEDPQLPRYIRITDFDDNGSIREETFKSLTIEKAKDYLLLEGDILFARSGATVGKTFQFRNYKGIACFAGYLIKATPNANIIISDFLYSFTKSYAYESWKKSIFIQSTIQNIGADKYQILPIPLPPLPEQAAIAAFLDRETARIDRLISRIEKQIQLLDEYKVSLITNAVTGKIDVRSV